MSRAITLPATFILLSACAQDFELNVLQEPELDGDTGWVVDTGEPLDTGEPWEEETETPVEENPTEPEPEEEEEPDPPAEDDCEDTSDLVYVIDRLRKPVLVPPRHPVSRTFGHPGLRLLV